VLPAGAAAPATSPPTLRGTARFATAHVDDAFFNECGIDVSVTLGRSTFDTKHHLVVACR
jgi:hypothetical protein